MSVRPDKERRNGRYSFSFQPGIYRQGIGITYFHNGFKIKRQALGNQFKWAELIKIVNYEQIRDSQAIGEANSRTKTKHGDFSTAEQTGKRSDGFSANASSDSRNDHQQSKLTGAVESGSIYIREGAAQATEIAGVIESDNNCPIASYDIQISDDIDDEAILGRNRHRKKMARTIAGKANIS